MPLLIPPQNFGIVEVDLYRSAHPNELNFPFLEKLRLRKIIHIEVDLAPELCASPPAADSPVHMQRASVHLHTSSVHMEHIRVTERSRPRLTTPLTGACRHSHPIRTRSCARSRAQVSSNVCNPPPTA